MEGARAGETRRLQPAAGGVKGKQGESRQGERADRVKVG